MRTLAAFVGLALFAPAAQADETPTHPEMWMFDTKPITASAPATGKTKFKITDHIYARVFYDRPIKDVFALTPTNYELKIYQKLVSSGSVYDQVDVWVSKKDFDHNYLDIDILPEPANTHTKYGEYGRGFQYTWINAIANDHEDDLKGTKDVYYEVITQSQGNKAQREKDRRSITIAYDFTGVDEKKLRAEAEKVKDAGAKAFSANFGLPKPGRMHTAALAKQAEAMTKRGNRELVAVKVIFTGDQWETQRNDVTGIIEGREAEAAVVMKERSGTCKLDSGLIRQDYIHGKFQAPGEWANTASTEQEIDCKKAFR